MFTKNQLKNGNTELHNIIKTSNSFEAFQILFYKLDYLQTLIMAKTVNNDGHLPITLLQEKKLSEEEGKKYLSIILPITKTPIEPILDLSTPIDFLRIKKKYKPKFGSLLEKNLKYACYAANFARRHINKSSTHPDRNGESIDNVMILDDEIQNQRQKAYSLLAGIIIKCVNDENYLKENIELKHLTNKKLLSGITKYSLSTLKSNDEKVDSIIKFSTSITQGIFDKATHFFKKNSGNCGDLANIVIGMNTPGYAIRKEIYHIVNGGHVFVVFGREIDSKENDYTTWGETSVVCDPWTGKIFPASSGEFGTYFDLNTIIDSKQKYNIVTSFNPHFHLLQRLKMKFSIDNINFRIIFHSKIEENIKNYAEYTDFMKINLICIIKYLKTGSLKKNILYGMNGETITLNKFFYDLGLMLTYSMNNDLYKSYIKNFLQLIVDFINKDSFFCNDLLEYIDELAELTCQALDGFDIEKEFDKLSNKLLFIFSGIPYNLILALQNTIAFQLPDEIGVILLEYLVEEPMLQPSILQPLHNEKELKKSTLIESKNIDPITAQFISLRKNFEQETNSVYFKYLSNNFNDFSRIEKLVTNINNQFDILEDSKSEDRVIHMIDFILIEADKVSPIIKNTFFSDISVGQIFNKMVRRFLKEELQIFSFEEIEKTKVIFINRQL